MKREGKRLERNRYQESTGGQQPKPSAKAEEFPKREKPQCHRRGRGSSVKNAFQR